MRQPPATQLWFLSVGQGDCAVFRYAGLTVLIDVGPAKAETDTAASSIFRDLMQLGVSRVDLALLSHPDSDHIGGLRGLSRLVPIGRVAAMRHFQGSPDLDLWLHAARLDEKDVLWLDPGEKLMFGAYTMQIDAAKYLPGEPDNHGSMFIRLTGEGVAADFTGDADTIAEMAVLRDGPWTAQILKAGHHGSRTATGEAWLNEVHPQTVVISCGRNNSYGHPAKEALDRIEHAGASVARTDVEGDVGFEARNGRFVRIQQK